MAFLLKAFGLSTAIPDFPFALSSSATDVCVVPTSTLTWSLRPGTSDTDDAAPVSIFSIETKTLAPLMQDMARNALKQAKSLRLGGVLRCMGGTEYQGTIYIATEPCQPLTALLADAAERRRLYGSDDETYHESMALGLHTVGQTLSVLHQKGMQHASVCAEAVYVVAGGGWRLFGLELVSAAGQGLYSHAVAQLPEYRRVPDVAGTDANHMDSWGFACLIMDAMVLPTEPKPRTARSLTVADLRSCRSHLPRSLQSSFSGLCEASAKRRLSVAEFLRTCDFLTSSPYVHAATRLQELSLLDVSEREHLFRELTEKVDEYPMEACLHVFLPQLMGSLTLGVVAEVVHPILRIMRRVEDPHVFSTQCTPPLLVLFQQENRLVRYHLLQHVADFADKVAPTQLHQQLWPLYRQGFTHPQPSIREYSVRGLVHLAPHLSQTILTEDVPQMIALLQKDSDGTIRTNATIGLSLILDCIPLEQRSTIAMMGFGRMLKDSFAPSRAAAARSMLSILPIIPVKNVAEMVVPAIAPLTLDAVTEIRVHALDVLQQAVNRLRAHHEMMPSEQQQQPATTTTTTNTSASATMVERTSTNTSEYAPLSALNAGSSPASSSHRSGPSRMSSAAPSPPLVPPAVSTRSSAPPSIAAMAAATTAHTSSDSHGWDDDGFSDEEAAAAVPSRPALRRPPTKHVDAVQSISTSSPLPQRFSSPYPSSVGVHGSGATTASSFASPTTATTTTTTTTTATGGGMKLRKGGLGARKMD